MKMSDNPEEVKIFLNFDIARQAGYILDASLAADPIIINHISRESYFGSSVGGDNQIGKTIQDALTCAFNKLKQEATKRGAEAVVVHSTNEDVCGVGRKARRIAQSASIQALIVKPEG